MIVSSISEDKNTVVIGDKRFRFVEQEKPSSCKKCAFIHTDDCDIIPCMPHSRVIDRKEGHFELITE